MKRFLQLIRKDLQASKFPILMNASLVIAWLVFLYSRLLKSWSLDIIAPLMSVPLFFMPFWLLWQCYQLLRNEWQEDTIYTLLLLPLPGWKLMASKLVTLLIEFSIFLVVYVGTILIFFQKLIMVDQLLASTSIIWFLRNGLLIYIFALAFISGPLILVQLAFVVGKLVGRFRGLVAIWVLLLASWLSERIGLILQPIFRWLPPVTINQILRLQDLEWWPESYNWQWDITAEIGVWLTIIALFFLSGWLLENYVETND